MNLYYKFEVDESSIKIINNEDKLVTSIDLLNGGSLQHLELNGITLIEEKKEFAYSESFASALLFPFVNRLKNGVYSFKNKYHQFPINETGGNAHHGVLFNKIFSLKDYFIKNNEAIIILEYESKGEIGYPFAYKIKLQYTFGFNYLNISFLGDSGAYSISSVIGYIAIDFFRTNEII